MAYPISQTFAIKPQHVVHDNALYLTKIDVYFKNKPTRSDAGGVTLQLREVESGIPTTTVLPFSEVYVEIDDINTSTTAATATTFTFTTPVVALVNKEYAFVVISDGDDPDYQLWTSKTGSADVATSKKVTQDANDGTLFTAGNGGAWQPVSDENLKYTLYNGQLTSATGHVDLVNQDVEFFSLSAASGTFREGEYVFKSGVSPSDPVGNAGQTIAVTAGNTTIQANDPSFGSLSAGEFIVINANSTVFDVLEIASVTNTTILTTVDVPKYGNNAATYFATIVGKVDHWDADEPAQLYLKDSSATQSNRFANTNTLTGEVSKATATIGTVLDKNMSYVQPNIGRTNTTRTKTTMDAQRLFRDDTNANYTKGNIDFNNQTHFNDVSTVVRSRSNELADHATTRSFTFRVNMSNLSSQTPRYTSPLVDTDTATIKMLGYDINEEYVTAGAFTVGESYIIRTVGDTSFTGIGASSNAVDVQFTATGAGSGTGTAFIDESVNDGEGKARYISKSITLADNLDAEDLNVYLTAYRPPGTTIEVYAKFLAEDDPEQFDAKVWTQLTGQASNPFSQNSNRFDFKEHEFNLKSAAPVTNAAFLNSSGVFEYVNEAGIKFNDFKYFTIKVLFWGTSHHQVPRLADIRAIALAA
jgi:hypothetical protein